MGKWEKGAGQQKAEPMDWRRSLAVYLHDFFYLISGILIVFLILFRVIVVSGSSMERTLLDGDYLLLLGNVIYQQPEAGDIVVVSKENYDHGKPIVKRVIATEGQIVEIDFANGIVYVDGLPLEEPYINTPTNLSEGMAFPLRVSQGCIFVMGDNRNSSKDSRSPQIGLVDKREILGKVCFLMFPGADRDAGGREYSRIGVIS